MFSWFNKTAPVARPLTPAKAPAISRAPQVDLPIGPASHQDKGISFNPHLISQYHADHRELLGLFGRAKLAAEAEQWSEVEAALAAFRTGLTDHLLSESIRLYVYLKQRAAADEDSMEMMRSFSSEMNGIGKVVMGFLDGQRDLARSPAKQGAFLPVWMDIGRTLGDRIAREEKTLYPMYQDSH